MYRLFIVEDDCGIAEAMKKQAEQWGYAVTLAVDFRNIMTEFAAARPQLVLLDISLPYYNGYHWRQEIRRVSNVPILFISSASDNMNIVMAMNMGADDFIAKPFDQSVLIAKIQAMLRRNYDFAGSLPVLEHQGALLNTGDSTLLYEGEKIELTRKSFDTHQYLSGVKTDDEAFRAAYEQYCAKYTLGAFPREESTPLRAGETYEKPLTNALRPATIQGKMKK